MNYAILSPLGLDTEPVRMGIVGDNFVRSPNGIIYVAGWWVEGREIPDSETHSNITAEEAVASLSNPSTSKSFAISGISDPEYFISYCGFVRCDEDGNDLNLEP